jgi:hypothetical protein
MRRRHAIRKFRRPRTNQYRIKRLCHLGEVQRVDEALVLLAPFDACSVTLLRRTNPIVALMRTRRSPRRHETERLA